MPHDPARIGSVVGASGDRRRFRGLVAARGVASNRGGRARGPATSKRRPAPRQGRGRPRGSGASRSRARRGAIDRGANRRRGRASRRRSDERGGDARRRRSRGDRLRGGASSHDRVVVSSPHRGLALERVVTRDSTTAHAAPQPVSAPLSGASRVLVLMPSWVGDVVMATPLLRAVRAARPSARIAALLRPGVAPMLDGSPWIDERFVARMKGAAGPWTGLGAARRFRADAVLLLPNSVRSGLAALALAPRRIGYRTPWRSFALTHSLAPPPRRAPVPAVDYYAELGEFALGEPIDDRRLELVVTEEQRRAAAVLLDDSGADDSRLGEDRARARRWLVVNPGANRIDKRWPAERFAEVAARLAIEHGLEVAVTGAPGERAIVASVVSSARERLARASAPGSAARAPTSSSAPRVVDLVERGVTLGSLKGVLAHASLLVTNDTGPRHVAAALG
ncbi:MAG: glycosyltransferase family 9 protein, partial [Phycisphaerae bacterium]|nr:glycosyltransferase family 9 protein [Phycisphaerae bacterium]